MNHYLRKAIGPSIMLFGAFCSQPFYVISMHVMNTRYNDAHLGFSQTHKQSAARNGLRAFSYIMRTYGIRGYWRGLLPTTLFSTIILWDVLHDKILSDD